jgi:hypothetical protein
MGSWLDWFTGGSTPTINQAEIERVKALHPDEVTLVDDLYKTDPVYTPILPDYFDIFSGPNYVEIGKIAAKNPEVAAKINAAASKPTPQAAGFYEKLFGGIGRTVSGAFSGLASNIQTATLPLMIGAVVLGGAILFLYIMGPRRS